MEFTYNEDDRGCDPHDERQLGGGRLLARQHEIRSIGYE
jgi:hypothetical protein